MTDVHRVVAVKDGGADDNDDQEGGEAQQLTLAGDERLPITGVYNVQQEPRNSRCFFSFHFLLSVTIAVLLAADVYTRISSSSSNKRWVPTTDILNSSGIDNLKYVHDLGDYGLQGLAVHQNLLYEFHTLGVRVLKMDNDNHIVGLKAQRIYNGTIDFPPLSNNMQVAHIGGVDYAEQIDTIHGDEIWIATHSDGLNGHGALFAVDPDTLAIKRNRKVEVTYNLDWVSHHEGILYFGEFFNVKRVKRVNVDTLENLPDLVLDLPDGLKEGGINYVQSAAFDLKDNLVLLGDDYQCTIYQIDVASGALVGTQGLLLGSEVDGITYDKSTKSMLVGFNRQHSHEQVMHQQPMVSVIKLELK